VVDPFCGCGEWGHICAAMGRKWIGCDIVAGGSTKVVV
jgi:DNA modification methylase